MLMLVTMTPAGAISSLEAWSWVGLFLPSTLGETLGLLCQTGQRRRFDVVPFLKALPRREGSVACGDGGLDGLTFEAE